MTNSLALLVEYLEAMGFSVESSPLRVSVRNPLSTRLTECVVDHCGTYITAWGYTIGTAGDEEATAHRIAYLLGMPQGAQT
ncbi:hypothetical protein [Streptomyces sp. NPDC003077]|uniref:hypothetical protein n=1 Tax=Streptomyces sp. NPDC003077 TaxID=3154443 RepID=UPI0033B46325